MLDGIELKGRSCVVALGITTEGVKVPLGLWRARPRTPPWPPRFCPTWSTGGLDTSQGVLVVIDGAKAL